MASDKDPMTDEEVTILARLALLSMPPALLPHPFSQAEVEGIAKDAHGVAHRYVARIAELEAALRNLIDRYDEVVTTPDCSCSQDDHDVMMARAALEAGQ